MSQLTDAEIVSALRRAVPEPPTAPARVDAVHHRVRVHRRRQLSAGSLALVAAVTAGVVTVRAADDRGPGRSTVGVTAPLVPMTGIPSSLYRPLHLPAVPAGSACPISASHTFPAGQGFTDPYTGVGDGPFVLTGNGTIEVNFTPPTNDSYYGTGWPGMKAIWRISDSYAGPLLVRGARLDASGGLEFDRYLGAVDGTAVDGTPFADLGYITSAGTGPTTYPSAVRVQKPGCYGIQVDGTSFSEVITFSVTSVHE